MIKVIIDDEVIEFANATDLTAEQIKTMFPADPNTDVTLTYVITKAPNSRRITYNG